MATPDRDATPPAAERAADESAADEARLAAYAEDLIRAVEAVLPGWVERSVARRLREFGASLTPELRANAEAAGRQCAAEVVPQLAALLRADVDHQRGTPLTLLRDAVEYPTGVLQAAGVPPVGRDEFAARAFPTDSYGLVPASFGEIDESLHEPGLVWGAAKAHVVLQRRRREGRI